MVFCRRKLRIAMPSASMPQTPRGDFSERRHGPCEHSEQRTHFSQKPQRVPMSSMRSSGGALLRFAQRMQVSQ